MKAIYWVIGVTVVVVLLSGVLPQLLKALKEMSNSIKEMGPKRNGT